MIDFEKNDEQSKNRDAKAGQGSLPLYDPLIDPWEEPSAAEAFRPAQLGEVLLFPFEWEVEAEPTQVEDRPAREAPATPLRWEQQVGPLSPTGQPQPLADSAGLSTLRRRLWEGAITIPTRRRRWAVAAREIVETVLLALLIFLAVRTSFQNFRVEGTSMLPSVRNDEYLIVNKLAYASIDLDLFDWLPFFDAGENSVHHLWAAPARGDVIVFRSPTDVDRDFIKRIIGVPGDTIEIDPASNQVRVNGAVVEEPYVQGRTTCGQKCMRTVPPANTPASYEACGSRACYFVMGDNRSNSSDSRQGWLVPEESIIGKALIAYWHDGGPELRLAPNRSLPVTGEAAAEE